MAFDIDVCIATRKKELNGLLCQIYTALNSGVNSRVTIGIDGEFPELLEILTPEQMKRVRIISGIPQGNPSICFRYLIEECDWSDSKWIISTADDDIILPWGLKHLWDATKDVSMVIGQTIGVSRNRHLDFSSWKIGYSLTQCHVSTCLFRMESLEKLPKPWMIEDPCSDFFFIKRMAENFPYKIIPSVVHVQAFAELENLGSSFSENFNKLYGHLL